MAQKAVTPVRADRTNIVSSLPVVAWLMQLNVWVQLLEIRLAYQTIYDHPGGYGWGVYNPADAEHEKPWSSRRDRWRGVLPYEEILAECARCNLSPVIDPAWKQDGVRVAAVGWIDIDGGDGTLRHKLVAVLHQLSYAPWVMNSSSGLQKFHVGLKADSPIPAADLHALLCEFVELLEPGAIRTGKEGNAGYVDVYPGVNTSVIRPACFAKPGQQPGKMLIKGEVAESFLPLQDFLAKHRTPVAPDAKCTPDASPATPPRTPRSTQGPLIKPPPLEPGRRNARIAPLVRYYKREGLLTDQEIIDTLKAQAIAAGCADSDGKETELSVRYYLKHYNPAYETSSCLFPQYLDELASHRVLTTDLVTRVHLVTFLVWAKDRGVCRVTIGQDEVGKALGVSQQAVGKALRKLERVGRITCVEHHVYIEGMANVYQLADSGMCMGGRDKCL